MHAFDVCAIQGDERSLVSLGHPAKQGLSAQRAHPLIALSSKRFVRHARSQADDSLNYPSGFFGP
jgi:hypothetical protein